MGWLLHDPSPPPSPALEPRGSATKVRGEGGPVLNPKGFGEANMYAEALVVIACQCRRHERHRCGPWVGKIPEIGNGNSLQYSCLENPMDRGAWRATVHGVTKSRTQLSNLAHTQWKGRPTASGISGHFPRHSHLETPAQNQEFSQYLLTPLDPPSLSCP